MIRAQRPSSAGTRAGADGISPGDGCGVKPWASGRAAGESWGEQCCRAVLPSPAGRPGCPPLFCSVTGRELLGVPAGGSVHDSEKAIGRTEDRAVAGQDLGRPRPSGHSAGGEEGGQGGGAPGSSRRGWVVSAGRIPHPASWFRVLCRGLPSSAGPAADSERLCRKPPHGEAHALHSRGKSHRRGPESVPPGVSFG